ncbi:GTP-binding protein Obg/CgtA [Myriangium duriaei CBS 260.36]|uniref:GTP-binding protein Obg/CgtA n=1 Tax=Myriangium duriaei CBS 260.36 TaxID=1168546 RepID=A0A9P4ISV7_9PEZI|nr:GTP-binding protein Obg/CgtA [Myriangium duriaei CBS 260.36]
MPSTDPAAGCAPRPARRQSGDRPPRPGRSGYDPEAASHLDPTPDAYAATPFTDQCTLNVQAGPGGHGCVSFLREKFIPDGPANGGDGGTGGNIFIQAVRGETSLHKLARRGTLKAGRGKNGRGKGRGGERGEDVLIQVPVGTIIREISRHDPVTEEWKKRRQAKAMGADAVFGDEDGDDKSSKWRREKWLLFPGGLPRSFTAADFPALPRPRRSNLSASQPKAPISLDLDSPTEQPLLLAAGAVGGLGNPHFVTKSITRPKFATKGEDGMSLQIHLELKILADVGLVGLPNAGKSTLLRSLTKSRTRVGNWAFTTLQPNVGTVVLDDFKTRPFRGTGQHASTPIESFTIADIPGLIEGAHLDKGLGLGFLRHVERAAVLGFVVELSTEDPVTTLKSLWREVGQYEMIREMETHAESERRFDGRRDSFEDSAGRLPVDSKDVAEPHDANLTRSKFKGSPIRFQAISAKPWFVISTKADLPETQDNFTKLQQYLSAVEKGDAPHPGGRKNAWRQKIHLIPVSAIKAEGVDRIVPAVLELLDGRSTN